MHDLRHQKQAVHNDKRRGVKVAEQQPHIHKNGAIKYAVPVQVSHSLNDALELLDELDADQDLHAPGDQQ